MSSRALIAVPFVAALIASPALAQSPADELFKSGVAQIKNGDPKLGCPLVAQSYKLDPLPGVLFALADCQAITGAIASAVASFDEYLRLVSTLPADQRANHRQRQAIAAAQKATLEPQVPKVTLVMPSWAANGTRTRLDGVTMGAAALGAPIPIDPGEHVVTTETPDGRATKQTFTIARGGRKQVHLEVPQPSKGEGSADSSGDAGPSGRRVGAYVAGGVGVVALAAGAITGALALGKKSIVTEKCRDIPNGKAACDTEGLAAARSGQTLGLVSTIGFGVGLAGLTTGLLLYLSEPKPATSSRGAPQMSVTIVGTGAGADGATMCIKGVW